MRRPSIFIVLGILIGCLFCGFLSKRERKTHATALAPLESDYEFYDWNDGLSISTSLPVKVSIKGRVWIENGMGLIQESEKSVSNWKAGISPWLSDIKSFRITDDSFFVQEWLLRCTNGGFCEVKGTLSKDLNGAGHLIGELSEVDHISLTEGIATTWRDLKMQPEFYHSHVIHVKGVLGSHPTLANLYLYEDNASWKARNIEQALLINPKYFISKNSSFQLLDSDGVEVFVDALFQRPYKGDMVAPLGVFVVIHNIRK